MNLKPGWPGWWGAGCLPWGYIAGAHPPAGPKRRLLSGEPGPRLGHEAAPEGPKLEQRKRRSPGRGELGAPSRRAGSPAPGAGAGLPSGERRTWRGARGSGRSWASCSPAPPCSPRGGVCGLRPPSAEGRPRPRRCSARSPRGCRPPLAGALRTIQPRCSPPRNPPNPAGQSRATSRAPLGLRGDSPPGRQLSAWPAP